MKIVKAATVGIIGGAMTRYRLGDQILDLFGFTGIPAWMAIGGVLATGSLLSEWTHDYVFPHIDYLDKMSEPSAAMLAAGVVSGSSVATIYMGDARLVNEIGLWTIVGSAIASEVAGDYVYQKFLGGSDQ